MSSIDVTPGTIVLLRCPSSALAEKFFKWIVHQEKAEEQFALYFKKEGIHVSFLDGNYCMMSFGSIIKQSIVRLFNLREDFLDDDRNLDLTIDEEYTFFYASPASAKNPTYRDVYNDLFLTSRITSSSGCTQSLCNFVKQVELTKDSVVVVSDWQSIGECLCMRRNFENVITVDVHDPHTVEKRKRSSFISDVLAQPVDTKLSRRDTVNYY